MDSAKGYSKAAKVTVPITDGYTLEEAGFWPDGIYCRRWYGVNDWSDIRGQNTQSYSGQNYDDKDCWDTNIITLALMDASLELCCVVLLVYNCIMYTHLILVH
jgi:hypothetical protein